MGAPALARLETSRTTWTPLLDGAESEKALDIVRDVLREADVGTDPSLCRGSSGLALLHAYAARCGVASNSGSRAAELIDRAADSLAAHRTTPWLADGFA